MHFISISQCVQVFFPPSSCKRLGPQELSEEGQSVLYCGAHTQVIVQKGERPVPPLFPLVPFNLGSKFLLTLVKNFRVEVGDTLKYEASFWMGIFYCWIYIYICFGKITILQFHTIVFIKEIKIISALVALTTFTIKSPYNSQRMYFYAVRFSKFQTLKVIFKLI